MKKTLVINMDDLNFNGDVLDVCTDKSNIIYCISKEIEDELSVDYVDYSNQDMLRQQKYDACTFFFNLNSVWTNWRRKKIIKRVSSFLKDDGQIFIWDISKERGKVYNNKIKVKLPKNDFKEVIVRNNNLIAYNNFEDYKKIIEKYYIIDDSKEWEDIFFIKGTLKKEEKDII